MTERNTAPLALARLKVDEHKLVELVHVATELALLLDDPPDGRDAHKGEHGGAHEGRDAADHHALEQLPVGVAVMTVVVVVVVAVIGVGKQPHPGEHGCGDGDEQDCRLQVEEHHGREDECLVGGERADAEDEDERERWLDVSCETRHMIQLASLSFDT